MNLSKLGAKMRRDAGRLLARGAMNAVDVAIHHEAPAAAPGEGDPEVDPWLESTHPAPGAARVAAHRAFVHRVTPESVVQRGFTELAAGDMIVDFAHDVPLESYRNPRFEIDGQMWQQKHTGRGLQSAWDAMVGGQPVFRTLLLEPER